MATISLGEMVVGVEVPNSQNSMFIPHLKHMQYHRGMFYGIAFMLMRFALGFHSGSYRGFSNIKDSMCNAELLMVDFIVGPFRTEVSRGG